MPGPPPTPSALKKLRGYPGKRRRNKQEPQPPRHLPTVPPPELTGLALAEWHRVAPVLAQVGILTEADVRQLVAYCLQVETFLQAEAKLKELGLVVRVGSKKVKHRNGRVTETGGYEQQSPWLQIRNKALELMVKTGATLGLDPASRTRLKAPDLAPGVPGAAGTAPAATETGKSPRHSKNWLEKHGYA